MKQKNSKGFTLLELLLYVAIIGTVLLAMSGFYALLLQTRIKNEVVATTDQEAILVLQAITQRLRNADAISSPTTGNTAAALTMTVPDSSKSPTLVDMSDGAIRIKEGAGATTPITSSKVTASALSFQNLATTGASGSAKIQFTLTYTTTAGRSEYSYSKTYYGSATIR